MIVAAVVIVVVVARLPSSLEGAIEVTLDHSVGVLALDAEHANAAARLAQLQEP